MTSVQPEPLPEPEVKTLTFVTMRAVLPRRFDAEECARLYRGLSPETAALLRDAEPMGWAPERHMAELMAKIYRDLLASDDAAYLDFARDVASAGISRFMGVFLSLASPRFVLRNIPVVWRRLRRNAGQVTAESDGSIVRLHYRGFPFFSDRVYRLLSLANCQALAFAACHRIVPGRVASWTADTLVLEFEP